MREVKVCKGYGCGEVVISIKEPIPVSPEPYVNSVYYDQAKMLKEVLCCSIPSGVVDRVLWLMMSEEVDSARSAVQWDGSEYNKAKLDAFYKAWEYLNARVNPETPAKGE